MQIISLIKSTVNYFIKMKWKWFLICKCIGNFTMKMDSKCFLIWKLLMKVKQISWKKILYIKKGMFCDDNSFQIITTDFHINMH